MTKAGLFQLRQQKHFNSHAHVERDIYVDGKELLISDFNSHAHVERDEPNRHQVFSALDFNSHAHVERDCSGIKKSYSETISTHTLTWSVTTQ